MGIASIFDGLSNSAYDPSLGLALGLLQAAGPSRMPVSTGQALGQGFATAQQFQQYQQQQEAQRQRAALQQQMQDLQNQGQPQPPASIPQQQFSTAGIQGFNGPSTIQGAPNLQPTNIALPGMRPPQQASYSGNPLQDPEYIRNMKMAQIADQIRPGGGSGYRQQAQNVYNYDTSTEKQPPGYRIVPPSEYKAAGLQQLPPGYSWQQNTQTKQYSPIGENSSASVASQQGPYDPDTLDAAATVVMSDPTRIRDYASFGQSGQSARIQIQKAITAKLKAAGMTPADLVSLRAKAHAEAGNLTTLTKQYAQVQSADQLIKANGQRVMDLLDMIDQTGVPMIEGFTRSARAKAGGVDVAEFKSVLQTFQNEVSRVLASNPNMTSVISDSARHEVEAMAPGNMSAAQAKRIINRLFLETDIRQQALEEQINKGAATSVVGAPQPTQQPAQPVANTQGWSITPVNPGG